MTDADHELMERCYRGDPSAFELLVRRWENPVARIIASVTTGASNGAASDVEDLSQEVFLRVLSARDRYHNGCAFSTWLYRIAVNVARDANRRSRTRWKALGRPRGPTSTAATEDAARIAGRREMQHKVSAAVATLPDKLREPLVLKQFGDMSFAEVAEVLNVPVSTIKSRVHVALVRLKTELKQHGIDESELET